MFTLRRLKKDEMKNTHSEISPKPNGDLLVSEIKSLTDTFCAKHRPEVAELASFMLLSTQLMVSFGQSNGVNVQRHLDIQKVLVAHWSQEHDIDLSDLISAIADLSTASQTVAILSSLPD